MALYQLTALAGLTKGASWQITAKPLVIGRDNTCDISLADPLVSRRHCELSLVGDSPFLRDLNSSNTTLVNGTPTKSGLLTLGDQICIGKVVFLVTQPNTVHSAVPGQLVEEQTQTLSEADVVYFGDSSRLRQVQGPHTIEDMVLLIRLNRTFSECDSVPCLIRMLDQSLRERFSPQLCWIMTQEGSSGVRTLHPTHTYSNQSESIPEHLIELVMQSRQGLLAPKRIHRKNAVAYQFFLASPIIWQDQITGIIVLMSDSLHRIYDESDLEFLVGVTRSIAPVFRALEKREELMRENERLQVSLHHSLAIIGKSSALTSVRTLASKVAPTNQPVLIVGETGTGKELLAHMIHNLSPRYDRAFAVVNCAAIPRDLFESQFFGHEKGSFTGAGARHIGLLEESDQGTLFLDEVGDLSLDNQARILRAVETGVFRRVGGKEDIQCDFRLISATNKNLDEATRTGSFRPDLYHRLRGIEIKIPPLRERAGDVPLLVEHFLEEARARFCGGIQGFSRESMENLCSREWRGNVRELKQTVFSAAILADGPLIEVEHLNVSDKWTADDTVPLTLDEAEKLHISRVLEVCKGNVVEAANLLKVSRTTLYSKMDKYGLR
ncbi:MAG: hypothetical protein AMXMBFR84_17070 [Candidatus Hydrogenedentota bacterium]